MFEDPLKPERRHFAMDTKEYFIIISKMKKLNQDIYWISIDRLSIEKN